MHWRWLIPSLWLAFGITLSIWLATRYSGIYLALSEWQFRHWEFSFPALTILLIAAAVWMPLLLALYPLHRRRSRLARRSGTSDVRTPYRIANDFFLHFSALAGFLAGAALVVLLFAVRTTPGEATPRTITIAELGPGIADGPARLDGGMIGNQVIVYRQGVFFAQREVALAPLADTQGKRIFVEVQRDNQGKFTKPISHGVLVRNSLSGPVRFWLTREGITTAEPYFVLYKDMTASRQPMFLLAGALALGAVLFGLASLFQRRHIRKIKQPAQEVPA